MKLCLRIYLLLFTAAFVAEAKRISPEVHEPIVFGNTEYLPSPVKCGLVLHRDEISGETIREIKFYKVTYNPKLEKDVQDVWFTDFFLIGDVIWARDEKGRIYKMLLKTNIPTEIEYLTDVEFEKLKNK